MNETFGITVHNLIKVLSTLDPDSQVLLENPDWSYRNGTCYISEVITNGNFAKLAFKYVENPENAENEE